MALALYDDQYGFYTQGPSIGRQDGAFNTSAKFPAFGFALAIAIEQAELLIGEVVRIVELGGGTGELGANISSYLSSPRDYLVIEHSPSLREQQERRGLATLDPSETIPPATTFMFGNEVLDALPVHRVMKDGSGQLLEQYVGLDHDGEFTEVFDQPSTPRLGERLKSEHIALGRGQIAEICLELQDFVSHVRKGISQGYLLFIDYGDEAKDLYSYTRRNGSLRSYRTQSQMFDCFDYVGEQDLTTDVDFTALTDCSKRVGLSPGGNLKQGPWLKNLGIEQYLGRPDALDHDREHIDQLTNMAALGSTFDVRIFKTSGLPDGPGLHLEQ